MPETNVSDLRLQLLSNNPLVPVLHGPELGQGRDATAPFAWTTKTSAADRARVPQRELVKLVLQVAHQCNLTCAYCCSDAGKWGSNQTGLMSPDLARRALRLFARRHGRIGTIYLFGGEPTLNIPAIDAVCDEAEALVHSGDLEDLPIIGFTTNGTILNDRLLRLLAERPYLKVSVSIDGPPEVHDRFRLDTGGRPTYERIVKNVRRLRQRFGKPGTVEITYSPQHQREGFSLWEMMRRLHRSRTQYVARKG